MARFFDNDGKYYFEADDEEPPFQVELNENNYYVHLHRDEPLKDLVGVEDPRDLLHWYWFRYDQDEERFRQMYHIAVEIGTVLMRSTALEQTNNIFFNSHQFADDEIDELLDGNGEG